MEKIVKAFIFGLGTFALIIITAVITAYPTMWAWNYVMPYLFGLKEISVLQAIALSFLASSLIKSSLTMRK